MGKASKALEAFINNIPDEKLTDLPTQSKSNLVSDTNFRLDMQGMTTDNPQKYNLQIQVNKGPTISTLKKVAPKTVALYLASEDDSPADIREGLLDGRKL